MYLKGETSLAPVYTQKLTPPEEVPFKMLNNCN
jgi:hypothetical protein